MYLTYHKWNSGIHYLEVAKRMASVVTELGWRSYWTRRGAPALHLWSALGDRCVGAPGTPELLRGHPSPRSLAVLVEELPGHPFFALDRWSLELWCFPHGYTPRDAPVRIGAGIELHILTPNRSRLVTEGVVSLMSGGVRTDFAYEKIK